MRYLVLNERQDRMQLLILLGWLWYRRLNCLIGDRPRHRLEEAA